MDVVYTMSPLSPCLYLDSLSIPWVNVDTVSQKFKLLKHKLPMTETKQKNIFLYRNTNPQVTAKKKEIEIGLLLKYIIHEYRNTEKQVTSSKYKIRD